jgi:hypothetical protein
MTNHPHPHKTAKQNQIHHANPKENYAKLIGDKPKTRTDSTSYLLTSKVAHRMRKKRKKDIWE